MLEKYPGEHVAFYIDCTALLGADEEITGTPTVASYPKFTGSSGLTIANVSVNANNVNLHDGTTVKKGALISMMVSGGHSTTDIEQRAYSIVATFITNAGNTLVSKSLLTVLPVGPV